MTVLFDAIVMIVVPIPLGLATRAFFDALDRRRGSERVDGARRDRRAPGLRALREPVDGQPVERDAADARRRSSRGTCSTGVLRGYGRDGLPASTGEAISLFRDDPRTSADSMDAFADLDLPVIFAAVAGVADVADRSADDDRAARPDRAERGDRAGVRRAGAWRTTRSAQQSTARLTGFLGELIGAQLAIKVSGARRPRRLARSSGWARSAGGWPSAPASSDSCSTRSTSISSTSRRGSCC